MAVGCVIITVCEWPARAGNLHVTYKLQRTIREGSQGVGEGDGRGIGCRVPARFLPAWGCVGGSHVEFEALGTSPGEGTAKRDLG